MVIGLLLFLVLGKKSWRLDFQEYEKYCKHRKLMTGIIRNLKWSVKTQIIFFYQLYYYLKVMKRFQSW
jgi:hypothetical protein